MPKRNSRRQSRAQKRQRRSLKGGRKGEEPKEIEEPKAVEEPEKPKEDEGLLSGLFGSSETPAAPVSEEPVTTPAAAEEPGLLSGIMGKKEEEPVSNKKKTKRHGKYYTNKQIDAVCAKKAKARRSRKMIKRGRRQFNNFEQPRNPYLFEPKM